MDKSLNSVEQSNFNGIINFLININSLIDWHMYYDINWRVLLNKLTVASVRGASGVGARPPKMSSHVFSAA